MQIRGCKTNHIVNPMGYDMSHVTLTWQVVAETAKKQDRAQIVVATDAEMTTVVYDTGMKSDMDNRGFHLDMVLKPYTRYYWTVKVIGDDGESAVSEAQWFETGKMGDAWIGQWITTSWEDQAISPYMRKAFETDRQVVSARAYIIGLGLYELEINGQKVGNELLTPYCTTYDAWLQYQSYDVTEVIESGNNVVGVTLGNGWAKGHFGTFGDLNSPYINEFALLCEIHVTYDDGTKDVIGSDDSWVCHPSAIIEDSIYDGEVFDANKILSGWSTVAYDDASWTQARAYQPDGLGRLEDRLSPPVIVKETLKPELIKTPAGEWVLDMKQNMVGWLKFEVDEPKDTKITISYGEILQDGNFYRDNLRDAKAQYVYISDGEKRTAEPHFTYYGFRFAKLEGFTGDINPDDFTGCVIYSDLQDIGHIETSDPLVNRLFLNAKWGQKGNFLDVPTDCPQRDERMGWTGDAQIFSGTASYNMDTYAFYTKFMKDLYEEQKFAGGMVASTVPTFSKIKHGESSFVGGGACAWSDAATIIPWEVYLHTGDKTILERQYQSMKDWVDWVIARDKEDGDRKLWLQGFQFGDWLALDGPVDGGVMGGTDTGLLASGYYRYSASILGKAAEVLGKEEDAKYYSGRSEEIKKAIQDEFFSKNGRSTVDTQTARVVALQFDLVEEAVKPKVVEELVAKLKKHNMHLTTGFIGTPYLCRALTDHGAEDEAYQVFFQEDYPGWLYEVIMGATTIWERWNSVLPDGKISGTGMNSLNHYAYGAIIEWVYRNVCGLRPIEAEPGFKAFEVRPAISARLGHAKATLDSPMGQIEAGWKIQGDEQVEVKVTVPFGATAKVVLEGDSITCDEKVEFDIGGDTMVAVVAAGSYTFTYKTKKAKAITYGLTTPLWAMTSNDKTREILKAYAPHLVEAEDGIGVEMPYSIQDVLDSADGFMKGMILKGMDVEGLAKDLAAVPFERRSI